MLREKAKDRQTAAPPSWAQGRKQPWGGAGSLGNGVGEVGDLYRVTQRQNQVLAPKPVLFASYHTASQTSFASCLGTEDHPALGVHPPEPHCRAGPRLVLAAAWGTGQAEPPRTDRWTDRLRQACFPPGRPSGAPQVPGAHSIFLNQFINVFPRSFFIASHPAGFIRLCHTT